MPTGQHKTRSIGQFGRTLRYEFGLELEEYQALLEKQEGRCAICRKGETTSLPNGKTRTLSVDHDHKTGHIRGLLCNRCNTMLGHSLEDAAVLRKGAAYLELDRQHQKVHIKGKNRNKPGRKSYVAEGIYNPEEELASLLGVCDVL